MTGSIEEIFAIFNAWAFLNEVIKSNTTAWDMWYLNRNNTKIEFEASDTHNRDAFLLWIVLQLATVTLALFLFKSFKSSPYFRKSVRDFFADYSLMISVITVVLIYRFVFEDISFDPLVIKWSDEKYYVAKFWKLSGGAIARAFGLAISISILFFFDQGFTQIVVQRAQNGLEKPGGFYKNVFEK